MVKRPRGHGLAWTYGRMARSFHWVHSTHLGSRSITGVYQPAIPHRYRRSIAGGRVYLEGFRAVLSKRSADACLMGTALSVASFQAVLIYASSFFRQRFLASTCFASIIILFCALVYTIGSLAASRFVKGAGRKPLAVLASLIAGAFTISYTNLSDMWASMALVVLVCLFSGVRSTALSSLTLEKVSAFRGTMMINSATANMGSALGAGVGGVTLLMFGYEGMAVSLGAMGIVAAAVVQVLAIGPTRTSTDR